MSKVEQIRSALSTVRSEHRSADSSFEYAQSRVERINNTPINIYYDDVHGRIREAINVAMDACLALYTTCQKLVLKLDKTCRPLLDEDTPADLIGDIYREIRQLNEDSEINNDYTGNLDGISFGDVAKIRYIPTDEAKSIEHFWEQQYLGRKRKEENDAYMQRHGVSLSEIPKHKRYMELVRKLGSATTSEAVIALRDGFADMQDCWDAAAYVAQCDARIAELQAAEAEAQRQAELERIAAEKRKEKQDAVVAECNAKVDAFGAALKKQVARLLETFQAGLQQQIAATQREKEQAECELRGLGFFAFGAKKAKKAEILRLEQQLLALQNPDNVAGEKKRLSSLATKAKNAYAKQVKEYLYKRFPCLEPQEPTYVFSGSKEGKALKVLYLMRDGKPYLVTDIMEMLQQDGDGLSSSYVTMLLRNLKDSGRVIRMEVKGRAYFKCNCDVEREIEHLKAETDLPYTETPEYADVPCPEPPSVDAVFGDA